MRILVDGQALQTDSRERGIGRYVEGLIAGLCANGAEVIVLFNGTYEPRCTEAIERISKSVPSAKPEVFFSIGNANWSNINGLDYYLSTHIYQEAVNRIEPDIYLCPSVFEPFQTFICPPIERISKQYAVAVVCNDLIPLENPDAYLSDLTCRHSYLTALRSLESADIALCNSRHTETALKMTCPNISTGIIWGASFSEQVTNVVKGTYIFYCGGLDDRKNVGFLCRAYSALPETLRTAHPLYICCRKNSVIGLRFQEYLSNSKLAKEIQLVEADTNKELAKLYSECQLFVFPSKSEGLGLPLIEALTFLAPVLTSNATSLTEIIDNPEAWFSPFSEKELTEKLYQALTDDNYLSRLQQYSLNNQYKFTWQSVGKNCLDYLKKLAEVKPRTPHLDCADLSFIKLPDQMQHDLHLAQAQQNKCTIYFDISEFYITKAHTGIQRVVKNFIKYLPESLSSYNFDIVFISGTPSDGFFALKNIDGKWEITNAVHPVRGDWFVAVDLTAVTTLKHKHVLESWKKQGVKIFYYVYDISFVTFPQFSPNADFIKILTTWLHFVVSTADCIMSDSQYATDCVVNWAKNKGIDVSHVRFINHHLGTDFNLSIPERKSKASGEFQFICVSTIEPRKGYLSLLSSFIKAIDNGMKAKLVVVGRPGWKADNVIKILSDSPYAGKFIIWENNCSDERLRQLYASSDCYVFASYDEGFGLGVVEAAQYGIPLLLRDIPVFREIAGDHALYFTEDTLTSMLMEIASKKMELLSVEGIEILTWKQSVQTMADQFIKLAKDDFYSYVKDPLKRATILPISELLAHKRTANQMSLLKHRLLTCAYRIAPQNTKRRDFLSKLKYLLIKMNFNYF